MKLADISLSQIQQGKFQTNLFGDMLSVQLPSGKYTISKKLGVEPTLILFRISKVILSS
jgi:hypothetical protein